ncbi:hypothetical protein LPJ70_003396, partial [Coemansia sp. RSA 2708]
GSATTGICAVRTIRLASAWTANCISPTARTDHTARAAHTTACTWTARRRSRAKSMISTRILFTRACT